MNQVVSYQPSCTYVYVGTYVQCTCLARNATQGWSTMQCRLHATNIQQPIVGKSSWENDWHPGNPSHFLFLIVIVARLLWLTSQCAGLLSCLLQFTCCVCAIWTHFPFQHLRFDWITSMQKKVAKPSINLLFYLLYRMLFQNELDIGVEYFLNGTFIFLAICDLTIF